MLQYFVHGLLIHTWLPTFVSEKINFYGGISTRIKDLSGVNFSDRHSVGASETEVMLLLCEQRNTAACNNCDLQQNNTTNQNSIVPKGLFFLLLSFLLGIYSQKHPDPASSLGT